MGLYEQIRDIAKSKGYSVNRLEKELGFARSSINKFNKNIPSVDKLQQIADFLGVTVDYLLGRDDVMTPAPNEPISQQVLMIYNGKPVWSEKYGWLLVRSADQQLLSYDGSTIPFADADQLFI